MLARNIRFLRKKFGLSQEQLAEQLGYKSYTTIQKWESGVAEPPLKKVHSIADLFRVDIDDLTKKDLELEDVSSQNYTARDGYTILGTRISETALLVAKAYDNADTSVQFSVCKMLDIPVTLDVAARDGQGGQVTLTIKQVDEGKKIRQRLLDEGADQSDL